MIGIIGLDYKTASINEREIFSLMEEHWDNFGRILINQPLFAGVVILFTCNRTEIYFSTHYCRDKQEPYNILVGLLQRNLSVFKKIIPKLYYLIDESAIKHLFRVVSGYESMIFGEAQIAAQVKEAYFRADRKRTVDTVLKRLFEKAFETGKKVRTTTRMNEGAFSVSYAGIEKCRSIYPDLYRKKILIIGAGKTGVLTLMTLVKKGCKEIRITNRTYEKSRYLGEKFKAEVLDFSEIEKGLLTCDIVFVATAKPSYLLTREKMRSVMRQRNGNPLLMVDYSVPRNVDPEVRKMDGIQLFDVDFLQNVLEENTLKRKKMMKEGLHIIEQAAIEYTEWLNTRKLKPVITQLYDHFGRINEKELKGFKKVFKAEQDELLDQYGHHITGKYVRLLIRNMKKITENGKRAEYIEIFEKLFEMK